MSVAGQVSIGVAAFVVVVLAALLWWWVPKWQMRSITASDPKERADIEDNFCKTVGQALGGIAVLIGAVSAYLQFSQQQKAASDQFLQQQETARRQLSQQQQATHDLLISNQVSKGFEQLGSDKIVVRLGGIYALEGVMNGSDQYHQSVLEALCSFVREGTEDEKKDANPATDIEAVIDVIRRREQRKEGRRDHVDLHGAQIPTTNLIGATLSDADLRSANLTGAYLSGANLSGAILFDANLTGADLTDAKNGEQSQLDHACGAKAKLPAGLTLKPCPGSSQNLPQLLR